MKTEKYLGIYLGKNRAAAACLCPQDSGDSVYFSVAAEATQENNFRQMASLIRQNCEEKQLHFTEASLAIDCAMFMQHNITSTFTDQKQIMQTVRFDTEEALAADITELAIAFKTVTADEAGSKLMVYTTGRKQLADMLNALKDNGIDPVAIEPDISSLIRFILHNTSGPDDKTSLYCILSDTNGYFLLFSKSRQILNVRTCLINPSSDRTGLLQREIPITIALGPPDVTVDCVSVFDSVDSAACAAIAATVGVETIPLELFGPDIPQLQSSTDADNKVNIALAAGASLYHLEKDRTIDFRNDFAPYQGKKLRLQKIIKRLSIAVTIIVITLGLYFQLQLLQKNKYRKQLKNKFEEQYAAVMFGKKPAPKTSPVKALRRAIREIEKVKSGRLSVTGQESTAAKLTLLLEAFNKCAKGVDLQIDTITVGTKTISVTGDTSNRPNTLKFFEAIKNTGLNIVQQRLDTKGGRDSFSITVLPKT